MFLNKAVVFALESEKAPDKKLFVEVDRAIEQGEIVVNMPEPVIKCEEMTLEQMFICCVRVNKLPIDDKVVLNYISAVVPSLNSVHGKRNIRLAWKREWPILILRKPIS